VTQKNRVSLDDILKEAPELAEASAVLDKLAQSFLPSAIDDLATMLFGGKGQSAQQEAPSAETKYRTLVEQIPAVVFLAYMDRGISEAYVSPQIENILGFTQEEWLNDPVRWYRQIHSDDKKRWSLEAASLFLAGEPLRSLYRVIARDGHVVWFQCEAKMVRRQDGRPWFIHGVGFDVTELKRAEGVIQQAKDELERRVEQRTTELRKVNEDLGRSNAELEQFAYIASHDLQEPLRMIGGFTDLIAKRYRGQLDSNADEFMGYILDAAQRMQTLIQDLLSYSRVGTKAKPFEAVSLEVVLDRALQNLRLALQESEAAISRDSLPEVWGDPVQLVEVLQNLIGNAIKFRSERPLKIHIGARRKDSEWTISIQDNGIGLDPRHADRIFLMFQRLHTREEYPGTGIGLAICKKIVERHGGKIWLESTPDVGTTFFINLRGGT
jgi:PAS domain S-box-containing protein